jgi:hypothetical protein
MNGPYLTTQKVFYDKSGAQDIYRMSVVLLVGCTVLQKVCIPGLPSDFPFSTILMPFVCIYALIVGSLQINIRSFFLFSIFVTIGTASTYINYASERISLLSMILVFLVQFPLVLRPSGLVKCGNRIIATYRDLMVVLAIGGIAQFVLQFVIGARLAFFIDYYLPEAFIVKGFGNINTLTYGSSILKSNGIFFLEPSFFGQYLAIGAIVELMTRQRISRMLVFGGALLCSFSGTGLVTLGLFGGYLLVSRGNMTLLVTIVVFVFSVYLLGDLVGIDAITSRTNELSTPGSSGHLRFVTPFQLIDRYVLSSATSFVFGRGPGAFANYQDALEFGATDASWSKVVLEYGFAGIVVYICLLFTSLSRLKNPLVFPIVFVYFFLGGYLTNAAIFSLIIVLLVWDVDSDARDRGAVTTPVTSQST